MHPCGISLNGWRLSMYASSVLNRFWEKVKVCEHGLACPYCCFEWQASTNHWGYGMLAMKKNGKWMPTRAHRIGWEILNDQPLPPDKLALHHCDNPPCCNGFHVYPGTFKDNSQDAVQRGRLEGRYHGAGRRGEKVPTSRLKEEDVVHIRALYLQGLNVSALSQRFGIGA